MREDKMMGEHISKSVFDEMVKNGPSTVPVTVEIGGHKRVIGDATLTNTEEGVKVEMTLNTDNPAEAIDFLSQGLTSIGDYSIAEEDVTVHEEQPTLLSDKDLADAEALFEFAPHDHKPVQHRDARPPWCNFCGLDVDLKAPKSRINGNTPTPPGNFGFPKPSRLHDNITNE